MAYIYKITNDINDKLYIGKTQLSVKQRFKEHCKDAFSRTKEHRPLYAAMRKYGIEHFSIEQIEETQFPNEREQYWIAYYNSYGKNGYNATLGGDGKAYIDHSLVVQKYRELQNMTEVAKILSISIDSVSDILQEENEPVLTSQEVNKRKQGKQVKQFDLNGNYIQSFSSAVEAARSLGKITSTSFGASSHITDACKGKQKTAYGYKWSFE